MKRSFKRKIHDILFKFLPYELKKQLLRGRISEGAGVFLFDSGSLKLFKMETYSQSAQDAFILNMIFGNKTDGFFLEIGANDPIAINNTYLFEKHGWSGMAFEPIASLAKKWEGVRTTKCYNVAVGDRKGKVQFTENKSNYLSHVGVAGDGAKGVKEDGSITYEVDQVRLTDFLNEKGIKKVDVAFIDVETYEINVLDGIDFEQTDITCICIESSEEIVITPRMDIREYIIGKGYRLVARLTYDDIFLKESYFE